MKNKKIVGKINKVANEISKNRKPLADHIHLTEEFIQQRADEEGLSFYEMTKVIENELMPRN